MLATPATGPDAAITATTFTSVRLDSDRPAALKTTKVLKGSARWLIASAFVLLGLAACGTESPTEYSAENQEAFMAACVDGPVDGIYQQRVCLCVYEEAEAALPFERFLEINNQLSSAEEPVLPDDLVELVAQCVIEEGDL